MIVRYLGVDPGASGGMALIDGDGAFAGWLRGEASTADKRDWLETWLKTLGPSSIRAAVEEVRAMPRVVRGAGGERLGLAKMGASSAFTFGDSFGSLKTLLICLRIPYDLVLPLAWQSEMRCRSRGDKKVTKARAQELFPGVKVTLGNADALLLAEFCRRRFGGER